MAATARGRGQGAVIEKRTVQAGPYEVELTRKNTKRAYLRLSEAAGPVRVSAPAHMTLDEVRAFVLANTSWIEARRASLEASVPAPSSKTGHIGPDGLVLLWGSKVPLGELVPRVPHLLAPHERDQAPAAWGSATRERVERLVAAALRAELAARAEPLVRAWEPRMGVEVRELRYRDMSTRWGTCSIQAHRVWLAVSLAHYDAACTELIVVHELCHLLERGHGPRFKALMTQFLPDWRERDLLLKKAAR